MFPKGILSISLLFLQTLTFIKSELSAENVVIAINCGGDEYKDSKGITYQKVNFLVKSRTSTTTTVRLQTSEPSLKSSLLRTKNFTRLNVGTLTVSYTESPSLDRENTFLFLSSQKSTSTPLMKRSLMFFWVKSLFRNISIFTEKSEKLLRLTNLLNSK